MGLLSQRGLRQGLLLSVAVLLASACGAPRGGPQEPREPEAPEPEDAHRFTVPFELIDSRIFLDVRLGGRGPFRFVLDTGATAVVDLAVARQLGLEDEEATTATGAGEAQVAATRAQIAGLTFGQASFRSLLVTVIDLSEVRDGIGFSRLDGILGLEALQQYVVTIDYARRRLTFVDGGRFVYDGRGQVIPFELQHHIPTIGASVDGVETSLWVDLGDRSTLTLTTPFIEAQGLRDREGLGSERITGWGVGGPVRARLSRVGSLRIGDLELRDVLVRLPRAEAGAFASDAVGGSLGNGLLRTRALTIDYRGRRLILGEPALAPATADRSGLWLLRRGGEEGVVEVSEVLDGSPAAEAGVVVGDRVVEALGQRGEAIDPIALREALSSSELQEVRLTLSRGGDEGPRRVALRLRDLE